ncbi:hypothetical protein EDD86DRAFT_258373 [Gorgonomyces haynaldii]|nr:hypothetical protein EDD86DRAFT_258373 [Gorgonomyces haynaldii]
MRIEKRKERALVTTADNTFVVFEHNGWHCIESVCPHSNGPLHLGTVDIEDMIVCPWHEYKFDLKSGKGTHDFTVLRLQVQEFEDHLEIPVEGKVEYFEFPRPKTCIPAQVVLEPKSLCEWAVKILNTSNPQEKVRLTMSVSQEWTSGQMAVGHAEPPEYPPRENQKVIAPQLAKGFKSATKIESRIQILHSLANVEQWAIDLAWDIIARFSQQVYEIDGQKHYLPRQFFDDFVQVAFEEATHFQLLLERLSFYNSYFGALEVHHGLWDSAQETKHSLLARLAIVHMVHEARGLDVNPSTIKKFQNQKDTETVAHLERIHNDEITHVAKGQKWFSWICSITKQDRYPLFHDLVRKHFRGYLKPPFNAHDRMIAGLDPQYYLPLTKQ